MGKPLKQGKPLAIKKAVYQFCLDHVIYEGEEDVTVKFNMKGFGNLWRRIEARQDGLYRNSEEDLKKRKSRREEDLYFFREMKNHQARVIREVKKGWNIKAKIALWLYNKTNVFLFGSNTQGKV